MASECALSKIFKGISIRALISTTSSEYRFRFGGFGIKRKGIFSAIRLRTDDETLIRLAHMHEAACNPIKGRPVFKRLLCQIELIDVGRLEQWSGLKQDFRTLLNICLVFCIVWVNRDI